MKRRSIFAIFVLLTSVLGMAAPAGAQTVVEPFDYGYFYGTFGEDPNILLLASGTAEDFCDAENPGTIRARTKVRADGSVSVSADQGNQPIHLYYIPMDEDAFSFLDRVCDGGAIPGPFASGTAKLTVRDTYLFEGGPPTRIFNSVKGTAVGTDGAKYRVRGAADIPFVDGEPVGAPPDWVSFSLTALR
jgi:hypothetical protein